MRSPLQRGGKLTVGALIEVRVGLGWIQAGK